MYITKSINQNGAVKMICFYLSKTKCFDIITKIKQDSWSNLFQLLSHENFIKIDIFSSSILVLMKQHVTMKHGSIYNVFVALNFRKRKNTSKGLPAMTQQILQPYVYRCLEVLAIKVFLATYIFNSSSKNNPISFLDCSLGKGDSKNICHSPFFATFRAQE